FWALVTVALLAGGKARFWLLATAALILPTIVGCHSRAAYIANVAIAFALAVVRWRWMLVGFPVAAAAAILIFPQIASRMGMDLSTSNSAFQQGIDWNEVTAGRTENIWMPVIPEIEKSLFIGHGRLAIGRTAATFEIARRERIVPTHPHNSYLELLLDFGLVGLIIVLLLLASLGWMALQLFRSKFDDPLVQIAGGIGFVAIANVMVLGLTSQFFYPKESLMWLYTASALSVRMWTIQHARRSAGVEVLEQMIIEPAGAYGHYHPQPGYNY
ncbi:MAG: O-antigen ligase family protein, partial [Phycisphaerae bacterium]